MSLDDAIRETVQKAVASELGELRRAIEALQNSIRAVQGTAPAHEYVDATEAAAIAGVKPQTVRRWIARGALRGHRAGRLLRVRVDELRAFLAKEGTRSTEGDGVLSLRIFGR